MFGRVYTFEPDELNFHCLVNNCQVPNIYKMQAALGMKPGLVRVNRADMINTGMHKVASDGECFVPMVNIDSLELPYCGFIQLDLEGYEAEALKGAHVTIERHSPVIQCEYPTDEVLNFMNFLGYEMVARSQADVFFKRAA